MVLFIEDRMHLKKKNLTHSHQKALLRQSEKMCAVVPRQTSLDNFSDCFASSHFFGKLHSGIPATAARSAPEPSVPGNTCLSLVSHAGNLEGGIERLDYLLNYIQITNEVSIPGSQECDCVAVFNLGIFSATGGQIQGLPLANRITVSVC